MKIAIISDSHGWRLNPFLSQLLEADGHTVVETVYKNGWGAKKYTNDRVQLAHIIAANPDLIIVSLGGNNSNLDPSYGSTIDDFLAAIEAGKRRVIWVGPATSDTSIAPSTARRHDWTADFLSGFLPNKGISFIDSRPVTLTGHRNDGVHFPESGYRVWADGVYPAIQDAMKPKPPVKLDFPILPMAIIGGSALLLAIVLIMRKGRKRS